MPVSRSSMNPLLHERKIPWSGSLLLYRTERRIENPRFFRTDEKALAKAQRKLSKTEKGTPERLSHASMNGTPTILLTLKIKNMHKNHHLAKSTADVAWNQFITITENKAEEAGSCVILVNPGNTSQQCSRCGMIVKKTLSDRPHSCPHCGLAMDRDQTAGVQHHEIGACNLKRCSSIPGCSRREEREQSQKQ